MNATHSCAVPATDRNVIEWLCPDCGARWRHQDYPAPNGGVTPWHWAKLDAHDVPASVSFDGEVDWLAGDVDTSYIGDVSIGRVLRRFVGRRVRLTIDVI